MTIGSSSFDQRVNYYKQELSLAKGLTVAQRVERKEVTLKKKESQLTIIEQRLKHLQTSLVSKRARLTCLKGKVAEVEKTKNLRLSRVRKIANFFRLTFAKIQLFFLETSMQRESNQEYAGTVSANHCRVEIAELDAEILDLQDQL